jgi:hypothetical protein
MTFLRTITTGVRHVAVLPCAIAVMTCVGLAGCESPGPALGEMPVTEALQPPPDGGGADSGLELRQWVVVDAPGQVMAALSEHGSGQVIEPEILERFLANGLLLVRVPLDSLDELAEDLGGTSMNVRAWHGQIYDWREVYRRVIDPGGHAIALDGNIKWFEGGTMALLARSWSVQMEDGPVVQLELLPVHRPPETAGLGNLLGMSDGRRGHPLHSIVVDVELKPGFAYVLTSVRETFDPAEEAAADAVVTSSSAGPAEPVGPVADLPETIGQFLFMGDRLPRNRGLLLFVPHGGGTTAGGPRSVAVRERK